MSFEILCTDSLKWLEKQPDNSIKNVITGIPDLDEIGNISIDGYKKMFCKFADMIFAKTMENGYCIFIQTDRKIDRQLIDKSYLLTHTAYKNGFKMIWHKIVCQRDVGKSNLFRPTYSHMLCYSVSGSTGTALPDVLPVGDKLYPNATPYNAADMSAKFVSKQLKNRNKIDDKPDVVDPFVGQGTIGVASLTYNLSFLGIDIDKAQCDISKKILKQMIQKATE
jgi:hypothetical protein